MDPILWDSLTAHMEEIRSMNSKVLSILGNLNLTHAGFVNKILILAIQNNF